MMSIKSQIKKYRFIFFSSGLAIFFFISCDKPTISFGNTFISNNNTSIVVIDTSTLLLSTISLDSFPTAGTGTQLIGRYHDDYFGTITSESFLQIGPPQGLPAISNLATPDSISLILRLNKTFYGDTTTQVKFNVSQLDTTITLPEPFIQSTFYNNSSIPFNPVPWGSSSLTISPTALHTTQNFQDSVKIRLPDSLAAKLLTLMEFKSDTVTNTNSFLSYFKGLCIYPDANSSGVIYGFRDTAFIKLYYHTPGVVTNYTYVILPFSVKSHQFNNISFDRSGTQLAAINSPAYVVPNTVTHQMPSSATTDSSVYLQGATGLQVKINFPYISNLLQLPDYIAILRADLILQPKSGTYTPELALPPQVILSQSNPTNVIGSTLTFNGAVANGGLAVDYIYGQNTYYTYDITSYIKGIITDPLVKQDALIFNMPSPSSVTTMNRAVFQNKKYSTGNYNVSLKIYYISLVH
ncbi:MAG TPA: DUF4270 family protein [Puia sp.]|jgi:hypothetical protein|nr:DUF4270 family protein [Puia sp.]